MTTVWLWLLVGVQPWLRWPGLSLEISSRLTLTVCCVGLGLTQMVGSPPRWRLPPAWGAWLVGLGGVLLLQRWPIIATGGYFEWFRETALLSDGLITLLAVTWGLWALLQVPPRTFRTLRWGGLAFLLVNLWVAVGQAWAQGWTASGVLGMDRFLAAYALAWLPVCWVWTPWLALVPVSLLLLAHKPLALLAAAFAWMAVIRSPRRWVIPCGVSLVVWASLLSSWPIQVSQRAVTWGHALQASLTHPWIGWGFSPMLWSQLRQTHGYLLPSLHSDWVTLIVSAGWLVALWAAWCWGSLIRTPPRTRWGLACQASLVGIGVLALVQEAMSQARIAGVMLVVLGWWHAEQRESRNV